MSIQEFNFNMRVQKKNAYIIEINVAFFVFASDPSSDPNLLFVNVVSVPSGLHTAELHIIDYVLFMNSSRIKLIEH